MVFLKFAQSGGTELDGSARSEPLNVFEIDVLDKLTAAGLDVAPQHGCSGYRIDFAVRHPTRAGQFVLAVEADGASYHSSPTARDRDRLRQEHLERLGWRFCRIWSTDWFKDHQVELERVLAAYEESLSSSSPRISSPRPPARAVPAWRGQMDVSTNDPQNRRQEPRISPRDSIDEYSHHELVALAELIESDGLLRTEAQLFDEMFSELPFRRRGPRITAALNRAITAARERRAAD